MQRSDGVERFVNGSEQRSKTCGVQKQTQLFRWNMHEVYVAEFFSGNSPDLREAIEKKN